MTVSIGNGVDIGNIVTAETDPVTEGVRFSSGDMNFSATRLLSPSGDVTGATDTAIIQAALDYGNNLYFEKSTGAFYTNAKISIPDYARLVFENGATIKRCDKISRGATLTSASTLVVIDTAGLVAGMAVEGTGIKAGSTIVSVGAGTIVLTAAATSSGAQTLSIYAQHNIFEADSKTGFSLTSDGWGNIDGNLANQTSTIVPALDSSGNGFLFVDCTNWLIDGIASNNHPYHGGFFTITQSATDNGVANIRINRYSAYNNGVRGLHARASGNATVWPGLNDVVIGDVYLRRNGRVWLNQNGGDVYDYKNGGLFIHVAGMRRIDINSVHAIDEYGVALQVWGDDNTGDPGNSIRSQFNHIGTVFAHNCGSGIDIGRGLQDFSFDTINITSDTLYAGTGASTDVTTLSELKRYAFTDLAVGTFNYLCTGVVTMPSTWTDAQIAKILPGTLLQSSVSGIGMLETGMVVLSVDPATKKATVCSLEDPCGINLDDPDGLVTSVTPSGAGAITLNGAQTTAGASSYTLARKLHFVSAGNLSARTFTVTGTDVAGAALVEIVPGPNATTAYTKQLFKTVSSISVDAACAAALTIGTSLARPYNITAVSQPMRWRGGRDKGININNAVSSTTCPDIKNISFDSVTVNGQGGYAVIGMNPSPRAAVTYNQIHFDKLRIDACMYGVKFTYSQDLIINDLSMLNVCRGIGGDGAILLELVNSSASHIGRMTVRHDSSEGTYGGECITVTSSSSDAFFGPCFLQTTGTVHARFNAPRCVITAPKKSSDGSALTVGGGQIVGTGSPVVWVPA